jgi:two-component system response regulator DegU
MMQKIRVLLVDDHLLMLDGLRHLLNRESDIEVVEATDDGAAVLHILDRCQVDVLLLDIQMPYHGFEVLKDIHQRGSSVHILLLTGHIEGENMRQAVALGAAGLALKTEPFPRIADAIRQVVQGRMVFPREIQRYLMTAPQEPEDLSPRELEVLQFVARGLTNSEIALKLNISKNTVGFHLKNIFCKLDVSNRTEATVWYFANKSSWE